ncbi:hypothetical protein Tco_0875486 [Tanacetum coccineum]|uniref:Uncharacterized protein n=1 Tax=Tanacetum coccineum TaxID=301880 RepID=A0ABQ5BPK3_9ASTR
MMGTQWSLSYFSMGNPLDIDFSSQNAFLMSRNSVVFNDRMPYNHDFVEVGFCKQATVKLDIISSVRMDVQGTGDGVTQLARLGGGRYLEPKFLFYSWSKTSRCLRGGKVTTSMLYQYLGFLLGIFSAVKAPVFSVCSRASSQNFSMYPYAADLRSFAKAIRTRGHNNIGRKHN